MRKVIIIQTYWLFGISTLPALAQTAPVYDLSVLENGAFFEYETSTGASRSSYIGLSGEAYVFSFWEKQSGEEASTGRMGVAKAGQQLWTEQTTPEGITSYYALPNDCSFTLGQCQADLVFGTRVLASISVDTTYANQIWTHIETTNYPTGESVTVYYCGIYDENSMAIALYMKDDSGGHYWKRIVSGPNASTSADALDKAELACLQFPKNSYAPFSNALKAPICEASLRGIW